MDKEIRDIIASIKAEIESYEIECAGIDDHSERERFYDGVILPLCYELENLVNQSLIANGG